MFVDRERELERLEQAWESERAELVVVYGRRRIGKTALLRQFCGRHRHTFWVASLGSEPMLRRGFTAALWQSEAGVEGDPGFAYDNWEAAFRAMRDLAARERHVVVIDEYPYLAGSVPGVSTILQKVWDSDLQPSRLLLILCGSSIGMMEREALAYRAPLYGRRTSQIRLGPLPARATTAFFPRYSTSQRIETYAVLGGIPTYLAQFDDRRPPLANIERHILHPDGYLHLEPEFLLREELHEPRLYFALLQAIAGGRTRLNDIAQLAGLERTAVARYLSILQALNLVERRVPVTEAQPAKSRKGVYRIADPFLRFWFRFVAPRISTLEAGFTAPVARLVAGELAQFTGQLFEDLCRAWVIEQAALGVLPLDVERVGAWWERDREIDIVAPGAAALLVGECKWTSRAVGTSVLDDLKSKTSVLLTTGQTTRVIYIVFAKSGFTPELRTRAEAEGVWLVEAEQVLAAVGGDGGAG